LAEQISQFVFNFTIDRKVVEHTKINQELEITYIRYIHTYIYLTTKGRLACCNNYKTISDKNNTIMHVIT